MDDEIRIRRGVDYVGGESLVPLHAATIDDFRKIFPEYTDEILQALLDYATAKERLEQLLRANSSKPGA